jgi:hypothetical protein
MSDTGDPAGAGQRRTLTRPVVLVTAAAFLALLVGLGIGALAFGGDDGGKGAGGKAGKEKKKPGSAPAETNPFAKSKYPPQFQKEPGDEFAAQFTTKSMFPKFTPERRYYVTRCAPGKVDVKVRARPGTTVQVEPYPARSGEFIAEARPLPGQDFQVRITKGGKTVPYKVRCLPAGFPTWSYRRYSEPPKGRFVVSYRPKPIDDSPNWVIVFDQDGAPRWWQSFVYNSLGSEILPDGKLQVSLGYGDGFGQDGRTAQEIRGLDGRLIREYRTRGTPTDGHEYVPLPNGNSLLVSYKPRLGVDLTRFGLEKNGGVLDGVIQELTPDGRVVWEWNSGDHVPLDEIPERWWEKLRENPHFDGDGRVRYDTFHLNSVEPWGNQYVISSRHTDRVYGISRRTGEILWTFGGETGPKSLKLVGAAPDREYPLGGQHDARIIDGDVLTVHDNGTNLDNKERPPRAARFRIDLKKRTATFLSEIEDTEVAPTSHCCGSFRQFGDGTLVAWGNNPVISGFGPDDQLAFRLWLIVPPYRAVPVPESVTDADLDRGLEAMEQGPPLATSPIRPFRPLDSQN